MATLILRVRAEKAAELAPQKNKIVTVDLGGVPQTGRLVRFEPDAEGATVTLEVR